MIPNPSDYITVERLILLFHEQNTTVAVTCSRREEKILQTLNNLNIENFNSLELNRAIWKIVNKSNPNASNHVKKSLFLILCLYYLSIYIYICVFILLSFT